MNICTGDYNELYGKLGKFMEVLLKHASNLDTILETISIPQHTLGVMAVLLVKLTTATLQNPADGHCLLAQVQDFIKHSNKEQVQLASNICKCLLSLNMISSTCWLIIDFC